MKRCILCKAPAVAIFYMNKGCICIKETIQALCPQHIIRSTPIDSMELIEDLTINQEFTKWWERKCL